MLVLKITQPAALQDAIRKMHQAENRLRGAERSVAYWRRKVSDLSFEQRCIEQLPLLLVDLANAPTLNKGDAPPLVDAKLS